MSLHMEKNQGANVKHDNTPIRPGIQLGGEGHASGHAPGCTHHEIPQALAQSHRFLVPYRVLMQHGLKSARKRRPRSKSFCAWISPGSSVSNGSESRASPNPLVYHHSSIIISGRYPLFKQNHFKCLVFGSNALCTSSSLCWIPVGGALEVGLEWEQAQAASQFEVVSMGSSLSRRMAPVFPTRTSVDLPHRQSWH